MHAKGTGYMGFSSVSKCFITGSVTSVSVLNIIDSICDQMFCKKTAAWICTPSNYCIFRSILLRRREKETRRQRMRQTEAETQRQKQRFPWAKISALFWSSDAENIFSVLTESRLPTACVQIAVTEISLNSRLILPVEKALHKSHYVRPTERTSARRLPTNIPLLCKRTTLFWFDDIDAYSKNSENNWTQRV